MSVEAISWALNLAPVPCDRSGKRNPACKAVLVGLANHAGPDGNEAFPSVRTLVRYTDLSERTVRTALDRLEAGGIIRPCDPAIVAAKIKRAGQRPQGWDLAMHLVRDDLNEEDLTILERQFPGLTARLTLSTAARSPKPDDAGSGVQRLHPNRPWNHPGNHPPPARAPSGRHDPAKDGRQAGDGTVGFFARLGASWPLTDHQRQRLAPLATAALDAGWDPSALAAFAGANTAGIRNPAAVLAARLSPTELPAPPGWAGPRPPWCGACDEGTRLAGYDGDAPHPCPACHPLAAGTEPGGSRRRG